MRSSAPWGPAAARWTKIWRSPKRPPPHSTRGTDCIVSREPAVIRELPYCGSAPSPGELLSRFNLDPVLIACLVAVCALQLLLLRRAAGFDVRRRQGFALAGWLTA